MKKLSSIPFIVLISTFLCGLYTYSYSQTNADKLSFNKFVHLFKQNSSVEIPKEMFEEFLGDPADFYSDNFRKCYALTMLGESEGHPVLVWKCSTFAGGGVDEIYLSVFKNDGELTSTVKLCDDYVSDAGDYSCSYGMKHNVIRIHKHMVEFEDEVSKRKERNVYSFLRIKLNGDVAWFEPRRYPEASASVMSTKRLESFSADQLAEMRNEIFAIHGYIFKTAKWSEFFGKKAWYEGKHNEVDYLLSDIERANVEMIRKVEKAKSK